MNNDLISREALKKQFEELHLHPDLIELIDNAPTVEKAILKERNVNKCLNCDHCCYSSMNGKGEITIMCNLGTGSCKPERPLKDNVPMPELYKGCLSCDAHNRCYDAFCSNAVSCNSYGKGGAV